MRSWWRSPHDGLRGLIREEEALLLCKVTVKRYWLWTRRTLTGAQLCWYLDLGLFQLPEFWEINVVTCKLKKKEEEEKEEKGKGKGRKRDKSSHSFFFSKWENTERRQPCTSQEVVLTRHQIWQHFDLGLSSFQNCEKYMSGFLRQLVYGILL